MRYQNNVLTSHDINELFQVLELLIFHKRFGAEAIVMSLECNAT